MTSPSLDDQELLDHIARMRDKVANEIQSLNRRIPQYRADFEEDRYPETLTMAQRLEERLAERKVDFEALTQMMRLVESQIP